MTEEKRIEIFERAPIRKAVLRQAIPAVASQMIALIYNLADTYFVGMLNEPKQTAAIMIVSSPFILLTAVSNLFGIGGASAISRSLGAKNPDRARKISGMVFWLGAFAAIFVSLVFLALLKPIMTLCGAKETTMDAACGYALWTIVIGGTPTILGTLLANCVRAEGGALAASVGVSMGGALNILLDPFFVLPQFAGLGATGAGMATAISNGVVAAYFLIYILARRKGICRLDIRDLRYVKGNIGDVLKSGFPSALQYALTVVAVAAQSRFVSAYGAEAVAALGIVKKLDQLPLYFSIGISTGILPLIAYNHTAGNRDRLNKSFFFGCALSLSFSVLCLVVYELFAPQLASIFIDDAVTINYAAGFLRRMVTAMPMMSVCYPMIIRFQATGMVGESILCSVLRKGVIDIPLLFAADAIAPLYGLMWVQPIVDTVSLVAAVVCLVRRRRKA